MRAHLVVLFLLFPILVAQSQVTSTRLSGMGNISIAVVDTESEAFSNPAKAAWLGTGLLRVNPNYFSVSNDFSNKSTGYSSTSDSWSGNNALYGLPVGVIIPVSNFRLGAAASWQRVSYHDESKSSTGGTYPQSATSTNDTKAPHTSLDLLASVDLGWGSVGAVGSWRGSTEETKWRDENSSPGYTYSSESAYEYAQTNHSYGLGLLFGAGQSTEVSLTIATEGLGTESKPTGSTYNGVPQDLSQPDIGYSLQTGAQLVGEVRKSYEGNVLAAIRMSYRSSGVDQSEKYSWIDLGSTYPLYEERKTGHADIHEYRLGIGLSKTLEGTGLFSVEYVYAPQNASSEWYQSTSGTYPDGRPYSRGSVAGTSDDKATAQEIRIGAELQITPMLVARGGLEVMWMNYGYSSRSVYSQSTYDVSGERDATYYGAGGFSYYFGSVRIDYSFGMTPYSWYVSSYSYSTPMRDIMLRHSATASFQF